MEEPIVPMDERDDIVDRVRLAFSGVEHPGGDFIAEPQPKLEAELVKSEFANFREWESLGPEFLDNAPLDLGSALSFLSDGAFRFFLPAYLIADLEGVLKKVDPCQYLVYMFGPAMRGKLVESRIYGHRTWRDYARFRFSVFSQSECVAILAYLEEMRRRRRHSDIDVAIGDYWRWRAGVATSDE